MLQGCSVILEAAIVPASLLFFYYLSTKFRKRILSLMVQALIQDRDPPQKMRIKGE